MRNVVHARYNWGVTGETGKITNLARYRGRNLTSGEPIEVELPKRRGGKARRKITMTMVDTDVMFRLEMVGSEQRVLWTLCKHVPRGGGSTSFVQVSQIAEQLGVAQSHVSRVLKELRRRRIVVTERTGQHVINPWIMWNGSMDDWVDESERWAEPIYVRDADATTGEVR